MKKLFALILASAMSLSLVACGGGDADVTPAPSVAPAASADPAAPVDPVTPDAKEAYLALVTDVGNIDDKSFNQGSYEGMVAYAEANSIDYDYFRPSEDSSAARVESINTAIDQGATTVVLPGFMFGDAIAQIQDLHPDVMFLGLDLTAADITGNGADAVGQNVALVTYQEEQSGYLAGYAAVKDGYTELGYLGGMAVPAVVRFGYGYIQGADDAAAELGIDVNLKYWYGNSFGPTDDIKVKMDSWYSEGTEVVFSCGGGIYLSAMAAAEVVDGKLIGVDVDQSAISPNIITSATKELSNSVVTALTALADNGGAWPAEYAGVEVKLGAAEGGIGLPTSDEAWRFETFTTAEYEEVLAKLISGEIVVSNDIEAQPALDVITVDYQG